MHWSSLSRAHVRPVPIARHIAVAVGDFATGGSERVAIRLANGWAAAGRNVTLFCGEEDGPARALVDPGVAIVPIAPRTRAPSPAMLGRALAGMMQGMRPDIVMGPGNSHVPMLRAMQAALDPADRPGIVCKLSNALHRADRSRLGQALFAARFRRMTRHFDALVAMSPALAREAATVLRRDDLVAIDEPTLDDARAPAPRPPAGGTILCIARLAPQKNLELALETFARLTVPRRLLILGEGDGYDRLRARAEALGIADAVRFVGYVADVRPYLRIADALLCTSHYEGYPAALVEALAAGVPVVTTPCSPALAEIMPDPSFGMVVSPHADALARALETVVGEGRTPAPGPLAALVARHQAARAANGWLDMLDAIVAVRQRAAPAWAVAHETKGMTMAPPHPINVAWQPPPSLAHPAAARS